MLPKTNRRGVPKIPYDIKVGACADYLIGVPQDEIVYKWKVSHPTVVRWIKARKCFKLRREK